MEFRSFEEARKFVHKLKLKSQKEWVEYCKSGKKPNDIPSTPRVRYKDKGWVSLGDWLGTGRIAPRDRKFRNFKDARKFVHKLKLKNRKEWQEYTKSGKKPNDIPSNPNTIYKNKGWVSYGDWLWTGTISNRDMEYRSFEDARKFVHTLKLKNLKEWVEYCKSGEKPNDIPSVPKRKYINKGWVGYGDWLGTGSIAPRDRKFRNFKDARKFVHSLKLKSQKEWSEYHKSRNKPNDIPSNPNTIYKNKGWVSWGDWLGTGTIALCNMEFRSFEDARKFVHTLKLKNQKEWQEYCKSGERPNDIPTTPNKTYKDKGWVSLGDWLGTGTISNRGMEYRSFEDARKFVHTLKIKGQKEWVEYCKSGEKPNDIPADPRGTYKTKGWVSLGDWLGTGRIANFNIQFRNFEDARKFVHTLKLKGQKEWLEYCKSGERPNDIPTAPNKTYKDKGWVSLGDWLGFRKFEEAREFVHSLKLKSNNDN